MAELAADSRSADSPPPPMPDDVLREILLRLPPEPIYLFRASSVSKHWRGLVHDAGFLLRCREFHGGTPPVLGFFNLTRPPLFVPTSGSFAVSAATMHHGDWWPLHCHRGRALLISRRSRALLVRDLVTGDERRLPLPPGFEGSWEDNCGTLCAAGHADNCHCRSCPFLVAFVFSHRCFITSACLYSSEIGIWGDTTSIYTPNQLVTRKPTVLVGNMLYCQLDNNWIIEFDFDAYSLDVIGELSYRELNSCVGHIIMPAEDGQLGLAGLGDFSLYLWSNIAFIEEGMMVTWQHRRVIDLKKFLAPEVVAECAAPVWPIGYAQDADVIFIEVYPSGVYMIHLKSMHIDKVSENMTCGGYVCAYTSFYAPGINTGGGDHQPELLNGS
uniref:Uncharacterized protein n=2 Tax=Avena sativa TaxID=4498 RepID=A0ACD5WCR1_AVESA